MQSYVSVPVPTHLVPVVMSLVAESFMQKAASTPKPDGEWTEAEVLKLWGESGPHMRQTLSLLVSRNGERVTGDEIATIALGKAHKGYAVAGMMGAFRRRCKGRHGGRCPILAEYDPVASRWTYWLDPSVLGVIRGLGSGLP